MRKISIFVTLFLFTSAIQAQELATYDNNTLDIPLVEVNGQYFSDVKVTLNGDGTWTLKSIGGLDLPHLLDSEPELEVFTREPDADFDFQAIARITQRTGGEGCFSLIALPQQIDGKIISVNIAIIGKITGDNEACSLVLVKRTIDIVLDTKGLSPGTYSVKYQDLSDEFILP